MLSFVHCFTIALRIAVTLLWLLGLSTSCLAAQPVGDESTGTKTSRFIVVDVVLDSASEPLAAYQLEISSTNGAVKIVGIEGGDPVAFRQPPYYDPAAMQSERVVLGAFSLAAADQLPRGPARVASVHCLVTDGSRPAFGTRLSAAATADGRSIPVRVQINPRNMP